MYIVKSVLALQGKLMIKLMQSESEEELTVTVAKEFLPSFLSADTKELPIDEEKLILLRQRALLTEAVQKALNALSYGPLSKQALVMKLVTKYKLGKAYARAAADYAEKHGYIDEVDQAMRIAELCVKSKKYGKRKIAAYLTAKGYCRQAVAEALDSVDEGELEEAAYGALIKKTKEYPITKEEKYKLTALLSRQGHSKVHIEKAFERLYDR